jgi:hypothetical protein
MNFCKRLTIAGLPFAVLFAGQAAHAQAARPDDVISTDSDRAIVVTGKQDPKPEVGAARAQARSITDAANIFDEPLALYQKKVCPGVTGLPQDLAELVVARIRYNVERAGLKVARNGNCSANLVVSFVLNGQKALSKYAHKTTGLLAKVPVHERKKLLRDPGPVHAWTITALRTRDGMAVQQDPHDHFYVVRSQSANSLFLLVSRREIEISVVVIDIPAIDGMSAVQIADYATMRGLAKTLPVSGDSTYSTILSLFDPDAPHPAELTTFDLAYLRTIYSNAPNLIAAAKLGGVKYEMRKQIEDADTDDQSDN